jgi:hypothetical protein
MILDVHIFQLEQKEGQKDMKQPVGAYLYSIAFPPARTSTDPKSYKNNGILFLLRRRYIWRQGVSSPHIMSRPTGYAPAALQR